jgi:hypothetical protein
VRGQVVDADLRERVVDVGHSQDACVLAELLAMQVRGMATAIRHA